MDGQPAPGRGALPPPAQRGQRQSCDAHMPRLDPAPLTTMQADGGTRCACINAAFMALAAAAVPCRDIVASCAAGYLEGTPLLDLNYAEVGC